MIFPHYDIIVVGGGHAGCEAAAAAARLGSQTLLITHNLSTIAQMSCNPAMGGIAKGQILREIDALGGLSAIVTDHTMIQFRMLNKSKGPAMWSPRSQNDRMAFSQKWQEILQDIPGLHLWQDEVQSVIGKESTAIGVRTLFAGDIRGDSVIITSGTFLNGKIHIGKSASPGGRLGEPSSNTLTKSINELGIQNKRLKTGTPVRVDKRSIDFASLTEQKGDSVAGRFSYLPTPHLAQQMSCYIAHTSEKTHEILREGFEDSPMFAGRIQGSGPRYCPSIEDKIDRFSGRDKHQLFIEPEGRHSTEYYINGFSSSLPIHIQLKALRSIPGFGQARILKPGYAIEYDYFPPKQLNHSLESKFISRLFFAGQVNGTTGYEEAAGQGLMAGMNAHLILQGEQPVVLNRSQAYIGVLIDDLVIKGTQEPYRMFTSRAEFRTLLRQDNADQRLTALAYGIGLADNKRKARLLLKAEMIKRVKDVLLHNNANPHAINTYMESQGTVRIEQKQRYARLLLRPQLSINGIIDSDTELREKLSFLFDSKTDMANEILESVEIEVKYAGYIEKERELAERIMRMEKKRLDTSINYDQIPALSKEAREKLNKLKPETIGQASRISGINPADISVLLVHLSKNRQTPKNFH